MVRKIVHIDMDAFYAAIEQRDNCELRGKPVIVGGRPDSRGVVCTCSYEAREYGVRSAMASAKAYKLCPQGLFISPNFNKYRRESKKIQAIFREYTEMVEPLSLDEAYLDVTVNKKGIEWASQVAREIKEQIKRELHLTASAGVSYNKFLAKVASDYRKPDGLVIIPPEKGAAFAASLEIEKFFGIGPVTASKMRKMGIERGADLLKFEPYELASHFGKAAHYYYYAAKGIDNRAVEPYRKRKSCGRESTFQSDITDYRELKPLLKEYSSHICNELSQKGISFLSVTLKIKLSSFKVITRTKTLQQYTNSAEELFKEAYSLLETVAPQLKSVRLAGVSVSHLFSAEEAETYPEEQLELPF